MEAKIGTFPLHLPRLSSGTDTYAARKTKFSTVLFSIQFKHTTI